MSNAAKANNEVFETSKDATPSPLSQAPKKDVKSHQYKQENKKPIDEKVNHKTSDNSFDLSGEESTKIEDRLQSNTPKNIVADLSNENKNIDEEKTSLKTEFTEKNNSGSNLEKSPSTVIKNKSKPNQKGTNKKIISVLLVLIILSIGLAVFSYYKYIEQSKYSEELIRGSIGNIKMDMDVGFETFEKKISGITRKTLNPLIKDYEDLAKKVSEQGILIKEQEEMQKALSASIAELQKNQESIGLKIDEKNAVLFQQQQLINNLGEQLKSSPQPVKKIVTPTVNKTPQIEAKKEIVFAKTIYSINGYSLFSIEIRGNEEIAVFLNGDDIKKVRLNETFGDYQIKNIQSNAGIIYLSKSGKRYSIGVTK